MAKKNGKSALIAALALVHLVGPMAIPKAEIYSAANEKEQASIIYRAAENMVHYDPVLMNLVKCIRTQKRLVCPFYGSFFQSLSAEAKTKEGLSPTVYIYDELGLTTDATLYESLSNAQGAWEEPLGFVISVQARTQKSVMSELVDDAKKVLNARAGLGGEDDPSLSAAVYEVPEDSDPFDEKEWLKGNPGLGDILDLRDMQEAARYAKRLPSRLIAFRNLRLNQRVESAAHLIGPEDWKACGAMPDMEALKGAVCYGGLDLSARFDLSALSLVFPGELTAVYMKIWTPEHNLLERGEKDNAHYKQWADAGYITTVPGKTIDYDFVVKEIGALAELYDLRGIAYDPWRRDVMFKAFDRSELEYTDEMDKENAEPQAGAVHFVPWRQGFQTMNTAIEAFEELAINHRLQHGMNPVLTWAVSNAVAVGDAAANRKLDKKKSRNRIDPLVALVMACGLASRADGAEPEPAGSIYDDLEALKKAYRG